MGPLENILHAPWDEYVKGFSVDEKQLKRVRQLSLDDSGRKKAARYPQCEEASKIARGSWNSVSEVTRFFNGLSDEEADEEFRDS